MESEGCKTRNVLTSELRGKNAIATSPERLEKANPFREFGCDSEECDSSKKKVQLTIQLANNTSPYMGRKVKPEAGKSKTEVEEDEGEVALDRPFLSKLD